MKNKYKIFLHRKVSIKYNLDDKIINYSGKVIKLLRHGLVLMIPKKHRAAPDTYKSKSFTIVIPYSGIININYVTLVNQLDVHEKYEQTIV